jgi:predicted RNA-binding Zn-ribbon protein involved in translation (DUF1610 family)
MGLICGCNIDWYPEPGDWYWNGKVSDYEPLPFKKTKKCCSCGEKIKPGDLSIAHFRVKCPDSDIEVKIYGEEGEIPLASDWMCERCGDLFLSLEALGYCVNPREDMRDLIREYADEQSA